MVLEMIAPSIQGSPVMYEVLPIFQFMDWYHFVCKEYELGEIIEHFNCTRVSVGQWLYESYVVKSFLEEAIGAQAAFTKT